MLFAFFITAFMQVGGGCKKNRGGGEGGVDLINLSKKIVDILRVRIMFSFFQDNIAN